jgi:hypothetical protein
VLSLARLPGGDLPQRNRELVATVNQVKKILQLRVALSRRQQQPLPTKDELAMIRQLNSFVSLHFEMVITGGAELE